MSFPNGGCKFDVLWSSPFGIASLMYSEALCSQYGGLIIVNNILIDGWIYIVVVNLFQKGRLHRILVWF